MMEQTDVLVVGAGLAGLAAAALLAQQGVRVVAAERHDSTSRHPKARLVNVRTMEIFRALGIEDQIRTAGEPNSGFVLADTLAGEHETWIAPPADESTTGGDLSPVTPYSCDQQRIEPILRDRAVALGARIRFSTTVAEVTDTGDGITARLGHRDVRARFLIAADGANGALRTRFGISRHGQPVDGSSISVLFRADLEPALRGRRVDALMARAAGAFLFARGNDAARSWQLGTYLRPGIVEVIRTATGLPDLEPVVDDVQTWSTGAYVADRFRSGRVFLVGDSAHQMPPYGGLGGNTGIHDAHNLAWKLAAVCRGDAPDTLLDSYHTERAPVVELTVAQALLRSRKAPGQPAPPDQVDATTLAIGLRYPGGDGYDPRSPYEDPAHPSGLPGTRAAHVALRDGRSILDLFDPTGFTFISPAGRPVTPPPGVTVRVVDPAAVVPQHRDRWTTVYANGATIRPDGYVTALPDAHLVGDSQS